MKKTKNSNSKYKQLEKEKQALVEEMSSELNLLPPVAQILVNRGIESLEEARRFLYPKLRDLHDPFLLKDMDKAVARVRYDLEKGNKILVYGDYDCDGITATAILVQALRHLGGDVEYYLPHRVDEGYGLHKNALQEIKKKGFSTVITVDCGINSLQEISQAQEEGLAVIVTDHHQPGQELPPALAVINPWRHDCSYPWHKLSGAGIAYKLLQALQGAGDKEDTSEYLDLVALGTIADIVPLLGENRTLVKYGLKQLASFKRPGVKALLSLCGMKQQEISTWQVAFIIAPRLNAAGRMDKAAPALKLLLEDDEEKAKELAAYLHAENDRRQTMEQKVLQDARELCEQYDEKEQVLVLAKEGWHPGVLGIVASRITELFQKPSILIALQEGMGKGSARSTDEFNIINALNACSDYLENYGGHEMAAGLSIQEKSLTPFRQAINRLYGEQKISVKDPFSPVDACLLPEEIHLSLADQLSLLEPFGCENPRPLFYSTGWKLKGCRYVGKKRNHLKMYLQKGRRLVEAIKFSQRNGQPLTISSGRTLDIFFSLGSQYYKEKEYLNMEVQDIVFADEVKGQKLLLVDRRGIPDKNLYLNDLSSSASASVVFINTRYREQQVASLLKGAGCFFCSHQGKVKNGLDGVEHLIFYDLPFMADHIKSILPALSRHGSVLQVHCLFSREDRKHNDKIMSAFLPTQKSLLYLLRLMQEASFLEKPLQMGEVWIKVKQKGFTWHSLTTAISIFQEGGLLIKEKEQIRMLKKPQNLELELQQLELTPTWQQNLHLWQESSQLQDLLLGKSAAELLDHMENYLKQ